MTPEDQLRTYGLTLEDAEALGIDILSGPTTASYGRNFAPVPSLQFNYRGLSGRPTGFFRVRYLEPVPDPKKPGKNIRYMQRSETPEAYLPSSVNWREVSLNPSTQIVFVEGEGKADCACKMGLICGGLGGVDSFQAMRAGVELVDPLPRFVWKDRSVVICFDSDAENNPNIVRAQTRFAAALTARGARVVIMKLPQPPPGQLDVLGRPLTKYGLDDYLLSSGQGIEGFEDLLAEALPPSESVELFSFNADYAAVMVPPAVVDIHEGNLMEPTKFQTFHLANRFFIDLTVNKGKVVPVKTPTAPRWIKWEGRRQYHKLVYVPGAGATVDAPNGKQDLNLWPGWGVEPLEPTEPGHLGPWNELLNFIFASEPRVRPWFEQWCAYPMQNPGGKLFSYVLLWSPLFGVGKTMIPYILMDIYGTKGKYGQGNAIEVQSKDMTGNSEFNTWQDCKQFVYGDEITSKDTRQGSSYIKGLITKEDIIINKKFIQKFTVPNTINYMFSSNAPDAMFVDPNDRRPLIHEVWGPRPADAWYQRLATWRQNGGARYVFWHLLHLDMTGFQPKFAPPDTAAKRNMARHAMTELGMWIDQFRDDPKSVLRGVDPIKAVCCDLWTVEQLLKLYDPMDTKRIGPAGMGKQLAAMEMRPVLGGLKIRVGHGEDSTVVRPIAVRNVSKWMAAGHGEVKDHWEKYHMSGARHD